MIKSKVSGFTLVELIIVILLIAIVSVYAVSRYAGTSDFSPFVAQEQVISIIRQVQVNRMQSNREASCADDSNTALRISSTCVGSVEGCVLSSTQRSDWVSIDGVNFTPALNCLEFNLLGEPSNAVDIQIRSGSSTCLVSIAQNGYVSQGNCS